MSINLPIAYDYHGDLPLNRPFIKIDAKDIHIYLDLDTNTGKNTCQQNCNHCWFVNYQKVYQKSIDLNEGKIIRDQLTAQGYKVFARYVDTFALGGQFMEIHGPVHNREFRQELEHKPTETMIRGDAWTSGAPLLKEDYKEQLQKAIDHGYGTISITFHGLINESIELEQEGFYPIKGVFTGRKTETVIQRIHDFNSKLADPIKKLRINIGVTIGRHNSDRNHLIRLIKYFSKQKIDTLRFNNFTDHGGRHPQLPMDDLGIKNFYKNIKNIHNSIKIPFQLAVSEDFGTPGIEVMEFPSHVGLCRAGKQLFTVIPADKSTIVDNQKMIIEKIGDIVACVNIFEPHFGILTKTTQRISGEILYQLDFDHKAIDEFANKRLNGGFSNGCFAKELLKIKQPALTQQAAAHVQTFLKNLDTKNTPEEQVI